MSPKKYFPKDIVQVISDPPKISTNIIQLFKKKKNNKKQNKPPPPPPPLKFKILTPQKSAKRMYIEIS